MHAHPSACRVWRTLLNLTPMDPRLTIFILSVLLWLTICQTLVRLSSSLYIRQCTFPTYPIIWYLPCSYGWMTSLWTTNQSSWLKIWLQRIIQLLWEGTTQWIEYLSCSLSLGWHQSSTHGSQPFKSLKRVPTMSLCIKHPNTNALIPVGLNKKLLLVHGLCKQGTVFPMQYIHSMHQLHSVSKTLMHATMTYFASCQLDLLLNNVSSSLIDRTFLTDLQDKVWIHSTKTICKESIDPQMLASNWGIGHQHCQMNP